MKAVVFDLGGVLVDWNPRYLLRKVMPDREEEMEQILSEVLNHDWNLARDEGDSWPEAIDAAIASHPQWTDIFRAYDERWPEMLGGDLPDTVAILAELRSAGMPLYALSNWSEEKFPEAEAKFEWLQWFDGVVVSGRVKLIKPDPAIFRYLLDTYDLKADEIIFIDDVAANVESARALGISAHHFKEAAALRRDLRAHGYLV